MLADRVFLQEGTLNTIQITPQDEKLSLTEKFHILVSYVQNEDQRLCESMKSLEIFTGQQKNK